MRKTRSPRAELSVRVFALGWSPLWGSGLALRLSQAVDGTKHGVISVLKTFVVILFFENIFTVSGPSLGSGHGVPIGASILVLYTARDVAL